jgi:hypothetical protein
MKTTEELIDFAKEAVGEDYIRIDGDSVKVLPYELIIDSLDDGRMDGVVKFKGSITDRLTDVDTTTMQVMIRAMNMAYSNGMRDSLIVENGLLESFKMSRVKF